MSYMRGVNYLWCDETHLHIWAADGQDGWQQSGWAESHGGSNSSGVSIPLEIVDDLVAMRLAELLEAGTLDAVVDRAVSQYHGNGGCSALQVWVPHIKEVLAKPR